MEFAVSEDTVDRILKDQLLDPLLFQKTQEILPIDHELKVDFCRFIIERKEHGPNFDKKFCLLMSAAL